MERAPSPTVSTTKEYPFTPLVKATRQVAVSLATRQVAYFSSPYFRRIIIHTLETKFVYG